MSAAKKPGGADKASGARPRRQRGGFVIGLVVGLLVGLALALAVALYITKAPVPFVNKVPQRTAEQDSAEAQRNRNWDPNAPLAGKGAPKPATTAPDPAAPAASAAAGGDAVATKAAPASARDPAAILAGGGTPGTVRVGAASAPAAAGAFDFFVQAGAFTRTEDAEQQRAKLALLGQTAAITEREQAGRVVYRVRIGPFPTREDADSLQGKLQEQSVESQIVRVERR
ncbi:SPOR domain-containing protein [Rubrivivax sp. A210]|uniref:SPOR domain-containing protein n=1 Tax=Rubrivivax sp. A210 TaxID=2772301 RepID=UPI001919BF69|nr:SPOR domain-containing protein [Rubrivivax sp. A210]CAD5373126.1 SPOR domain-containing protein [Rubrivivax sp. A210]